MVLQQKAQVPIWGKAKAGAEVEVTWKNQSHKTKANARGEWQVVFDSGEADAEGSSITATDKSGSTTLENILVGDVWLASGQSNMEFTIQRSAPGKTPMEWNNPSVRMFKIQCLLHTKGGSYTVEQYQQAKEKGFCNWSWEPSNAQSVRNFSAVAAYFAHRLQQELNIPIGIICNAVGGTGMESWTPKSVIDKAPLYTGIKGDKWLTSPDFDGWMRTRANENLRNLKAAGEKNLQHPFCPGSLFERTVRPLTKLPIKGVIWYQGESNADDPDIARNSAKLSLLITSWRAAFHQEELPFLMVQLPRIVDPKRPHWGAFRLAQKKVADALPGVDLICTVDLGETRNEVHPRLKEPVGFRLTDLALRTTYGKETPRYPEIVEAKKTGKQLILTFSETLRTTDGQMPRGFELAKTPAGPFSPAENVRLEGNKIILQTEGAGAVWRYNEGTALDPNLASAESGLPAFSARGYKEGKNKKKHTQADRSDREG